MTVASASGGGPDAMRRSTGVAALATAGFLFGSTFLVVQDAVGQVSVWAFLAARFLLAAAVLWPFARRRGASEGEIRHGVVAGLSLFAGFALQTQGLRYTSAATSAFITYLLVVLVPLLHAVRTRRMPSAVVMAGVGLAVAGLFALPGGVEGFGRGEALTLLCAVAFAVHLLIVAEVTHRHDPVRLTFWQVATVGAVCVVPGMLGGGNGFDGGVWAAVVFTAVGATAMAFGLMTWGQRVVPESQAALILLVEPVSAGLLGELVGEHLGTRGIVGAVLILAGVVVAEVFGPTSRDPSVALPTELGLPGEAENR